MTQTRIVVRQKVICMSALSSGPKNQTKKRLLVQLFCQKANTAAVGSVKQIQGVQSEMVVITEWKERGIISPRLRRKKRKLVQTLAYVHAPNAKKLHIFVPNLRKTYLFSKQFFQQHLSPFSVMAAKNMISVKAASFGEKLVVRGLSNVNMPFISKRGTCGNFHFCTFTCPAFSNQLYTKLEV